MQQYLPSLLSDLICSIVPSCFSEKQSAFYSLSENPTDQRHTDHWYSYKMYPFHVATMSHPLECKMRESKSSFGKVLCFHINHLAPWPSVLPSSASHTLTSIYLYSMNLQETDGCMDRLTGMNRRNSSSAKKENLSIFSHWQSSTPLLILHNNNDT